MQMSERKKMILASIINLYIQTGEPVGSKLLAAASGLNLSSATLRNEMSELSEMGYLEQPHTSAGSVPSQQGYRMFVDCLMSAYQLSWKEKSVIDDLLFQLDGTDLESLLEEAGELLASFTGCATVSAVQKSESLKIRRVELILAGRHSLLLVLLTDSGVIKSRLCKAGEDLSSEMVSYFSRLINEKLSGKTPEELKDGVKEEIKGELYEYTFALIPVLDAVFDEVDGLCSSEAFLGGETNLLKFPGLLGEKAVGLISFLEKREELARLVEDVREGVRVRIGSEIGPAFMQDSSLIATPYRVGGRQAGAIGIIGPTRMNYPMLMSSIEYFSTVLSRIISETFSD